jgi:hypothetical protein
MRTEITGAKIVKTSSSVGKSCTRNFHQKNKEEIRIEKKENEVEKKKRD